nr:unnamed protein product [Callosobruchus chinensis]
MNAVSVELENLQYIESGSAPETPSGSQGQTTFSVPICDEYTPVILGDFEGRSNLDVSGPIANLGVKHLYRVKFDATIPNWSIFWADQNFDNVPEMWRTTVNTYREREYPELTFGHYNTEVFDPRGRASTSIQPEAVFEPQQTFDAEVHIAEKNLPSSTVQESYHVTAKDEERIRHKTPE